MLHMDSLSGLGLVSVWLLLCGLSYWAAWILPFGKTLLARVVASKASMLFFSCAASEFVEFVGVGASRVRDLFEKA